MRLERLSQSFYRTAEKSRLPGCWRRLLGSAPRCDFLFAEVAPLSQLDTMLTKKTLVTSETVTPPLMLYLFLLPGRVLPIVRNGLSTLDYENLEHLTADDMLAFATLARAGKHCGTAFI